MQSQQASTCSVFDEMIIMEETLELNTIMIITVK